MSTNSNITIRRSSEADRTDLARLAQLDSKDTPQGDQLLAYVDDELLAAVSIGDRSAAVADPFHLTNDVVELLRFRAAQEVRLAA
jgi:hypothetical protein